MLYEEVYLLPVNINADEYNGYIYVDLCTYTCITVHLTFY